MKRFPQIRIVSHLDGVKVEYQVLIADWNHADPFVCFESEDEGDAIEAELALLQHSIDSRLSLRSKSALVRKKLRDLDIKE